VPCAEECQYWPACAQSEVEIRAVDRQKSLITTLTRRDHGEVYTAPGLLVTGGTQLSQRGKRILGHELAGLIERALN